MYRIARRASLDRARDRRGEVIGIEALTERQGEPASPAPGPEERAAKMQNLGLLQRALDLLPADKREILALSRFQEMKYEEIAAVLDCEVGAVKVRGVPGRARVGADLFCAGEGKGVMTCEEIESRMAEYWSGTLDREGESEVERHLEAAKAVARKRRGWARSGGIWRCCPGRSRTEACASDSTKTRCISAARRTGNPSRGRPEIAPLVFGRSLPGWCCCLQERAAGYSVRSSQTRECGSRPIARGGRQYASTGGPVVIATTVRERTAARGELGVSRRTLG